MMRFIWGTGLSEHAWQTAEETGAAWVGNDAFAQISLLRRTVAEELAVGMEQRGVDRKTMRAWVDAALEDWGLADIADRDPMYLSTGQTRRVAIAAALLTRPDGLVLDCPLDGLDEAAARHLTDVLADFPGDVTVYGRTASVLSEAADEQWFLQDGRLTRAPVPALDLPTYPSRGAGRALLEARSVEVRGKGPFDLVVPAGQITHLSGANGSGKTSLMLAALGLVEHTGMLNSGSLGWAPTALDRSLIGRTVLGEVAAGGTEKRAQELLEQFGLSRWAEEHPLDVPTSDRRLVLVAAAMVRDPDVLMLDEPLIGLDAAGQRRLLDAMDAYTRTGRAVLWTCHDEQLAATVSDQTVRVS